MDWYYKTIRFVPTNCNNEFLAAKCINILHGFSYRYDTRSIGVSFPNWCNETVGDRISFVSIEKMTLDYLLTQNYFKEMQDLGYFNISKTLIVPIECNFACFKRYQKIDKSSAPGFHRKIKRLAKRAHNRGEVFDNKKYNIYKQCDIGHYHSLAEESKSKGYGFRLNIQRTNEVSINNIPIFSSYGLANTAHTLQSVPII